MSATTCTVTYVTNTLRFGTFVFSVWIFGIFLQAEEVQLTWNDNSDNEDGFNVERSVGDGPFELLAQTAADVSSYVDTTARPGIEYQYRVNAFNAFGVSGYTNVAPHYINVAPSISGLSSVEIEENEIAEGLTFLIEDFETAAADLIVEASSSNENLIAADGIAFSGSGKERTLTLSPKVNLSGESTIRVSVSDGEDTAGSEFVLTVNPFLFPSLDLQLNTVATGPRVGEAFSLNSTVSNSAVVSAVRYYLDGEYLGEATSSPYAFSTNISEEGEYLMKAVAIIAGREETVEDQVLLAVGPAPSSNQFVANLRTFSQEIGSAFGTIDYDLAADAFYLESDGGLIGGGEDSHQYYFLRAEGDVSFSANLSELEASSTQALAGLMLRSSLVGKSGQTALLRSDTGSLHVRTREEWGGETTIDEELSEGSGDVWLRIDRVGNTVKYYAKGPQTDAWDLLTERTLDLGDPIFVGFAVAGGTTSNLARSTFTQASFEGSVLTLGSDATGPGLPSGLVILGGSQ